jgi:acetyl esterase/lipase
LYSRNGAASLAVEIGSKLAALEYRLAPEHPWPAALEDSLAAYEQLLTDGIPAEGIAIIGESAGGGLALATVLAARERGLALPAAVAVLSPWCDLTMSNITLRANAKTDIMLTNELLELASTLYTDGANRDNPLISPLFGDYSNFPPVLFQVAAEELLLGEIIQTANRAAAQSPNEVALEIFEGMWHVWQTMDEIVPEARQAVEKIGVFLNKYLPGHKNTVNVDTDKISGHMYKNKAGAAESSEQKS